MKKILILFILVTAIGLHAYAQNTVTGIVRDSINNSPLVGATILIKGTTIGAISDFNGNFLLKSPPNSRLVISFIGYKTKEIIYVGQISLDISLVADLSVIDEVVVVGYGTQKKSHLTGAISKVTNDGMGQIPVARADEALIGKVSGVTIQMSDAIGASRRSVSVVLARSCGCFSTCYGRGCVSLVTRKIDMNDLNRLKCLKTQLRQLFTVLAEAME
jgi:hypothetical protein